MSRLISRASRLSLIPAFALILGACTLGIETTVAPPAVESTAAAPSVETLPADPTPQPGGLVVSAEQSLGPISPLIYGSNYGPWVVVPLDLLDEAKASGVRLLRFPGGEWGDRNNISELQIDRFVTFARDMGAEPTIHVRLLNGTPEQAAEMVRYANIEKGYGLRYWTIGNEPNLYPDDYSAEQFVVDWRSLAEAMLAVDPTIQLLGPEVNQFVGGPPPGPNDTNLFLDEFLKANGDLVDVVTVHRYPLGTTTGDRATVDELLATSAEWDRLIPDLRERIRNLTGRDIPVGVMELNSYWTKDWGDVATPDSYSNAVWLSDVLARMIRQRVDLVAHFILVTKTDQGPWGLLGDTEPRPSYYVYQLYDRFGQEQLYAASGEELVTLVAARRDDGALTLMAINRGAEAAEMPLALVGHAGGTAEVYRLDADRVAAVTVGQVAETAEIADGSTIILPPYSATLFVLP